MKRNTLKKRYGGVKNKSAKSNKQLASTKASTTRLEFQKQSNSSTKKNGPPKESKSAKKREKIQDAPVIVSSGPSTIKGVDAIKSVIGEAKAFKHALLTDGVLGVLGAGVEKLGQGHGLSGVHYAITGLPSAISVFTETDNEKYYSTTRGQVNRASVESQGLNVIGDSVVFEPNNLELNSWRTYMRQNSRLFGCPIVVTDALRQQQQFDQQIDNRSVPTESYNWDTADGTPYGAPNTLTCFETIQELNTKVCWLCNLPLMKQSPMVDGKPGAKPQFPHCEHVLSILDALFYLTLYESEFSKMMKQYRAYIQDHYYKKGQLGQEPTLDGMNAFAQSNYTDDDWERIQNMVREYLYAHPDCNLEKNDDSLLAISPTTRQLAFNDKMAKNLATRIWKKRFVPRDSLLDKLGIRGSINQDVWTRNIIQSWKQRMDSISTYINSKRFDQSIDLATMYGFASICKYLSILPEDIKSCLLGATVNPETKEVTLTEKGIFLVPSSGYKLLVIQRLSMLITDTFLNSKNPNPFTAPVEGRSRRFFLVSKEQRMDLIKQVFEKLVDYNSQDGIGDYMREQFILGYYKCVERVGNERVEDPEKRYSVIRQVTNEYCLKLLDKILANVLQGDIAGINGLKTFYQGNRVVPEEPATIASPCRSPLTRSATISTGKEFVRTPSYKTEAFDTTIFSTPAVTPEDAKTARDTYISFHILEYEMDRESCNNIYGNIENSFMDTAKRSGIEDSLLEQFNDNVEFEKEKALIKRTASISTFFATNSVNYIQNRRSYAEAFRALLSLRNAEVNDANENDLFKDQAQGSPQSSQKRSRREGSALTPYGSPAAGAGQPFYLSALNAVAAANAISKPVANNDTQDTTLDELGTGPIAFSSRSTSAENP
jgi:hypothetical protein